MLKKRLSYINYCKRCDLKSAKHVIVDFLIIVGQTEMFLYIFQLSHCVETIHMYVSSTFFILYCHQQTRETMLLSNELNKRGCSEQNKVKIFSMFLFLDESCRLISGIRTIIADNPSYYL